MSKEKLSRVRVYKGRGLRPLSNRAIAASELLLDSLRTHPKVEICDVVDVSRFRVNCNSEQGKLRTVVVSLPTYLDWDSESPINVAEASNPKPSRLKAVIEHTQLIGAYLSHGVNVIIIRPDPSMLEGAYTRDIAFVIDDKCFRANLVADSRKPEQERIIGAIDPPPEVQIEGGNVVLAINDLLLLGIGKRTNMAAFEWLQGELGTSREVKPIRLTEETLHLDCAFGPIVRPNHRAGGGLVYPASFVHSGDIDFLARLYTELHTVSEPEYRRLGANVTFIEPTLGALPTHCPGVVGFLEKRKVTPVELVLDEIISAEGAGRCSSLPLIREQME